NLTLQLTGGTAAPGTLNLNSFQFGFHDPATVDITSPTGFRTGPTAFDALDVTTVLSNASPDLFKAVASGARYDTSPLTEPTPAGQPIASWTLGTVFITDDLQTGTGSALPGEELKFGFESITEANSVHSASWSVITRSGSSGAGASGLSPLPTPPATNLTLQ